MSAFGDDHTLCFMWCLCVQTMINYLSDEVILIDFFDN